MSALQILAQMVVRVLMKLMALSALVLPAGQAKHAPQVCSQLM
jgi:hypothetical protein